MLTGGQTATPLEIKAIFGGGPDNVRIEASQEWNCRHKENSSTKPRTLSKSRKRSRDWTMRRYPCSVFNQSKKVTNDSCAREFECHALRRIMRRAALLPLWGKRFTHPSSATSRCEFVHFKPFSSGSA